MFATTHFSRRSDLVRILLLAACAAFLALLAVSRLLGASGATGSASSPRLLPPAAAESAAAISGARDAVVPDAMKTLSQRVSRILLAHREGHLDDAIAGWNEVSLQYPAEIWKQVALGAAHLQLGQWPEAADALDAASRLDEGNPLVHYFTGLLRLEQAAAERDWNDAIGPQTIRLAGWVPREVVPNSRSNYRMVARMELERALARADCVDAAEPLLPDFGLTREPLPKVGDLLRALKAEHFEADAHHVLGGLYLEQGMLTKAENHFDCAAELGATIVGGYSDLGAAYAAEHAHGDAMRAYAKAIKQDPNSTAARQKFLENFGQALLEAWQ